MTGNTLTSSPKPANSGEILCVDKRTPVTDAEATLQNDLSQFNSQHTKSLLGTLVEEAKKRQSALGDIHRALQSGIAV